MQAADVTEARVDEHALAIAGPGHDARRTNILVAIETVGDLGRYLGHVFHDEVAVVGDSPLHVGHGRQGQHKREYAQHQFAHEDLLFIKRHL